MNDRSRLLSRIYHLKLVIAGVVFVLAGLLLSLLADWLGSSTSASHLVISCVSALSDVFLVTGAIGIAVDFFTGRDKEAADTERTRTVLKELTPDFVDAVVQGFAVSKDDLKRVATPDLLDGIATNVLALRLGDEQFASEIYADIRDQAIRASERWYDVNVAIRLSAIAERKALGLPLFEVFIEWEYSTIPRHATRTFACVSDREEFRDLASDAPATSTWFMAPRPGLDASQREAFELLYFSVDGEDVKIRRQQRRGGQAYVARIPDAAVRDRQSVRIRHIYRTRTTQSGHFLFIEMPQPARGLSLTVDYEETEIAQLRVTDLLAGTRRTQLMRMPSITGEKSVNVDHAGWVLPKAGVAIAWTLVSEAGAAAGESAQQAA